MLLSGDVEKNTGPPLRGMQWNCAGLSQGKRLALHKTLVDERIAFCLLSETRKTPGEAACFSVASYKHHGIARNCKGGGVSILVKEDLPVETGMAVVGRIEQVHATIHLARGTALTVTSAYIPPKHTFTETDLDTLLTTDAAQLIGTDANAHALAWDRASPPNVKGETLTQWCIDNQFLVCNTGECTRYARHHGESTPDVTLSRNCTVYTWTSLYSPDSDHHHIFFDVIVGDAQIH
ncbi:Endonuclease-reverse transcriptase [Trypanosoma brucei equiperdum]|uniref:Endonuclease-reverse transcriptase n=1 Tax=Trypanosoma brucei equiperdum TaxID=630700 RepID=A0A3L6LDP7_9TRYP|nr:Endonuclease-reverse transcriptase [Trypanosoma brucei equiperdum]